ncbi:MAG: TrkA family potassium uptake protein [Eubacteriaceae bacterium]|jgi:trk system potassium uptake protein TrkA|nr:TrkA family potassium uptake protein [Eubacteriaceae bacterium]
MAERKSGFGIIGLGKFGLALTEALASAGKDVLVIDEYEENLHLVRDVAPEAYLVGKITKEALEETGIANCETVIVCITKVEVSVMTVYNVLDLGIPRVIAKAANKEHGAILERLGAEPIFPETDTALRVAAMLLETEAVDMIKLYDNYVISEIVIPAGVRHCTVEDLRMDDYHLKLVAVEIMQNGQKVTLTDWSQDQVLHGGDFIVAMGKLPAAEKFEKAQILKRG